MSITPVSLYSDEFTTINSINGASKLAESVKPVESGGSAFDEILSAAVDMYSEANSLQKAAESAEMSFALGYTDSIHDLAIAQQKANISLQYTVKVTNAVVSAYKELMAMQI
ncbi:MAG: flagellar hook-basal body complex protein FliE [Lachnospiraceae bacterium]|nr:flagellar hook-basal body complex protein FliE [Lachnospiraceae bacterium]